MVPAKDTMVVTADAWAQAAAGTEVTSGRRVHTVRHGQGRTAWTERLEPAIVGIAGLTIDDQSGTVAHGRHPNRRDFQPTPLHAVVVRQGNGRDDGPGGQTVCLTKTAATKPWQPFYDDDRRIIENCGIKAAKQQWNLGHPPQKNERVGRLQAVFTLLMLALATAYRGQLLQRTREKVIVFAQHCYGIVHVAEDSLLLRVELKKPPPGFGMYQEILAIYGLAGHS